MPNKFTKMGINKALRYVDPNAIPALKNSDTVRFCETHFGMSYDCSGCRYGVLCDIMNNEADIAKSDLEPHKLVIECLNERPELLL